MVLFTRWYKVDAVDGFKPINFYNQELVCTGQVKYLGVILDSKQKWKAHVDAKCIKAIVAFSQLLVKPGAIPQRLSIGSIQW